METRMTIKFSDITGGGIPYGNTAGRPATPGVGKLYSNGELQRLEIYTGSTYGWQNIVAETPGVTGYTGTVAENNITNTITILGTNFSNGAVPVLIGNNGTEYAAISSSVNSLNAMTATFGVLPANNEPYDVKVTNPSNLYGIYYDLVSVNDAPIWNTAAGSLGTFAGGSSVSVQLSVSDEESNALTYSVSSGSLPAGLTLNSSTGLISGTATNPLSQTTYNFSISASDGTNTSTRSFSMIIPRTPVITTLNVGSGTWTAPAGITSIKLLMVGGGGGGGNNRGNGNGGGGGGGGIVYHPSVSVTPGQSYSYSVGSGGVAAAAYNQSGGQGCVTTGFGATVGGGGGGVSEYNNNCNGAQGNGSSLCTYQPTTTVSGLTAGATIVYNGSSGGCSYGAQGSGSTYTSNISGSSYTYGGINGGPSVYGSGGVISSSDGGSGVIVISY